MNSGGAAILLDWDGVLCDSLALYFDLYEVVFRRYGRPLPISSPAEFRDWYNPNWERNYYDSGFSPDEFADVQVFAAQHLDYENAALFPGVAENLRQWAAAFPLAVVSTTPSGLIRARLRKEGLEDCFTLVTGGDDGLSEKRDKVRQTLQQLGVSRGVMVGDTALDVDAGKHNGLRTVGVTYGWIAPERVRASEPDRLVERPEDLGEAVLAEARTAACHPA